ncbi:crotonase/enoyl-CoA hydratase family protein [Aciditerrimonas ferrireducens]|uniref:crotonase/enoyl-CoA hydratase family protein n=1 Tax=Aciditerrimonas ferrireducens TaxID=667306 RepID=UPI0020048D29|nr:crotonase/enoyl-CoA hydratase family protein [Aciditerrimonas ferrireducens]MCK4176429.1 crotonase/enoyl-CoA hydratase family protein [Aciditerrimonas ferrireducens]
MPAPDPNASAAAGPALSVLSVQVDRDRGVGWLWLDRAEARNAMGRAFFAELPQAIGALGADPAVRAVVVAARGPHFSVGLDLKELGSTLAGGPTASGEDQATDPTAPRRSSPAARAFATRRSVLAMQAAITAVADCPKPVLAAVHGACVGGGVDLVTACDIRLASAEAFFSVRETKVAIVADLGTLQRLPRIVPAGAVAELCFTGKDVPAERARALGLVNDVLPDPEALWAAAGAMAAEIAANPPLAVQGTKAVLRASADRTIAEGLDYVATWNAGMLQSDDLVEAMTAFVEKRPPRFTGT